MERKKSDAETVSLRPPPHHHHHPPGRPRIPRSPYLHPIGGVPDAAGQKSCQIKEREAGGRDPQIPPASLKRDALASSWRACRVILSWIAGPPHPERSRAQLLVLGSILPLNMEVPFCFTAAEVKFNFMLSNLVLTREPFLLAFRNKSLHMLQGHEHKTTTTQSNSFSHAEPTHGSCPGEVTSSTASHMHRFIYQLTPDTYVEHSDDP
ncbi:uncharacterized protein LOC125442413 [Sphaerodactylus townsendi]|uniref:uncharacterized protein LOC125442413 n=1 Tax=Sphaerodactylus townsendi TaxID=933632 RepID=UPI0020268847|nr:uncharacterized protein LOC125442413 [Sphaerodactylus townsendi]